MESGNHSVAVVFALLGLTQQPELLLHLFLLFLGIYVVTAVGNLGMTCSSQSAHCCTLPCTISSAACHLLISPIPLSLHPKCW
ncbi:Odorant receptor K41 [Apodemus speciosus]|uniref:Odorant receptor K41 n=1 Tax=Apodemus speciosus TaxID=105296 RepID=A0ABQ0F4C1_APOSI